MYKKIILRFFILISILLFFSSFAFANNDESYTECLGKCRIGYEECLKTTEPTVCEENLKLCNLECEKLKAVEPSPPLQPKPAPAPVITEEEKRKIEEEKIKEIEKQKIEAERIKEIPPLPIAPIYPTHYKCYKIEELNRTYPKVEVIDQFGNETLRIIRAEFLCVPAAKELASKELPPKPPEKPPIRPPIEPPEKPLPPVPPPIFPSRPPELPSIGSPKEECLEKCKNSYEECLKIEEAKACEEKFESCKVECEKLEATKAPSVTGSLTRKIDGKLRVGVGEWKKFEEIHYKCYLVEEISEKLSPGISRPIQVNVKDQFGIENLTVKNVSLLCNPAKKRILEEEIKPRALAPPILKPRPLKEEIITEERELEIILQLEEMQVKFLKLKTRFEALKKFYEERGILDKKSKFEKIINDINLIENKINEMRKEITIEKLSEGLKFIKDKLREILAALKD